MKKIIYLMLLGAAVHATVAAESDKSKKQASAGVLSKQGQVCGHPQEDPTSTLMRIANDRPPYELILRVLTNK